MSDNGKSSNGFEPEITAFLCNYCAYMSADTAGTQRIQYPANVKLVRLPCTGKTDVRYILKAFEDGADGAYVAGCEEGACHFAEGNYWAKRRVRYAKKIIAETGLNPLRLEMFNFSASMFDHFVMRAKQMDERIRALGPSPVKPGGAVD